MGKHTHIVASNALRHNFNCYRNLAGLENLVAIRLILTPRHDVTLRDVINVVASDLTNQLTNMTVPANEPISNHRVMHKVMQNYRLLCIKLGIDKCATNFHFIFIRVHVKSLNVVYEP